MGWPPLTRGTRSSMPSSSRPPPPPVPRKARPVTKSSMAWGSDRTVGMSSAFALEGLPVIGGEAHDHLADIVAGEEPEEGLGRVLDALDHGLLALDASRLEPAADFGQELRIEAQVVGDDEALHVDTIADHRQEVARARVGRVEVVLRDHAAERDAREGVDLPQHHIQERAAHVLEVDVDALGAGL